MDRRDFLKTSLAGGVALSPFASAVEKKANAQQYQLRGIDVYGKPLDLKDYLGRTTLVSFFTFDCSVCSHDLKLMRDFYLRNVTKKFVLLGVNIDQNKKDLEEYNDATTLAYPKDQRFPTVWRFAPGHQDNFGPLTSTPTHFVLNPKHQLMFKRDGAFRPDDWDNLWLTLP